MPDVARELHASYVEDIRRLIKETWGFVIKDAWLHQLTKALAARAEASDRPNALSYARSLASNKAGLAELSSVLEEILIHETSFFRNPAQFDALREIVLPDLQDRRPGARIRIGSFGCSSGEEPYSIAIAAAEVIGLDPVRRVEVCGVDVSQKILRAAKEATYSAFQLRELSMTSRARWFEERGGKWVVRPELRQTVRFLQGNLLGALPLTGLDVIFCRNVLIYFEKPVIARIMESFHSALNSNGYLFLGHTESAIDYCRLFRPVHHGETFFFQKRGVGAGDPV